MSTEKKILSLNEIEAQMGLALPDREMLHVSNGGTNYINDTNAETACNGNSSSGLIALTIPICPAIAIGLQLDANTIPITLVV